MVLTQIDRLQLRSQILRMILSRSNVLDDKMKLYKNHGGSYNEYYELLKFVSSDQCTDQLKRLHLTSIPVEVRNEMQLIMDSPDHNTLFFERKELLIEVELSGIVQKAQALLGRSRSRCC